MLPILLLLILGILYFGQVEEYCNQATQLAEEGARWAAVDANPAAPGGLDAYIESQLPGNNAFSSVTASVLYPSGSSNTVGNSVTACLVLTPKAGFLGFSVGTITETSTMRIEQPATTPTAGAGGWTADTSYPSSC